MRYILMTLVLLLVLGCGESTVRLMPPLVVEQEHADIALEVLERCIGEVEA